MPAGGRYQQISGVLEIESASLGWQSPGLLRCLVSEGAAGQTAAVHLERYGVAGNSDSVFEFFSEEELAAQQGTQVALNSYALSSSTTLTGVVFSSLTAQIESHIAMAIRKALGIGESPVMSTTYVNATGDVEVQWEVVFASAEAQSLAADKFSNGSFEQALFVDHTLKAALQACADFCCR